MKIGAAAFFARVQVKGFQSGAKGFSFHLSFVHHHHLLLVDWANSAARTYLFMRKLWQCCRHGFRGNGPSRRNRPFQPISINNILSVERRGVMIAS
jgi:hypothetical protein